MSPKSLLIGIMMYALHYDGPPMFIMYHVLRGLFFKIDQNASVLDLQDAKHYILQKFLHNKELSEQRQVMVATTSLGGAKLS